MKTSTKRDLKIVGGFVLELTMMAFFLVNAFQGDTAETILFGSFVLMREIERQVDRIVTAIRGENVAKAVGDAINAAVRRGQR